MKIINLKWLSEPAKEAELVVSDGIHKCLVFSQPCNVHINQIYTEPLHAIDVDTLMKADDKNFIEKIIKTDASYFSQFCVAKVEDMENGIVKLGKILIKLDVAIPGWASKGDLVEFKCARLDIW